MRPHYVLTSHAQEVIIRRKILEEWISRTLENPSKIEPDRSDPELQHALLPIEEFSNRILRVIYNKTNKPWRVVTAYFDRKMKDLL